MQFADSFALAPSVQSVAARLIQATPEFSHLVDQRIVFAFSERTPMLHGAPCLAFIAAPNVQGPLHWLVDWLIAGLAYPVLEGESPDYLVLVDAALWPTLDAERQDRLVFHELCHVVAKVDEDTGIPKRSPQDGRILTKLVPHDYELFAAELLTYGPLVCGADQLAVDLAEGHARAQRRNLKLA